MKYIIVGIALVVLFVMELYSINEDDVTDEKLKKAWETLVQDN